MDHVENINIDRENLENIDTDIDKGILENIDINIDQDILGKTIQFSTGYKVLSCFFDEIWISIVDISIF